MWLLFYEAGVTIVKDILSVQSGVLCVLIGTLYKDMKAKPNILEEYNAREVGVDADERHSS